MISPLIQKLGNDTLSVCGSDGTLCASPFASKVPGQIDVVHLQIITQHGSAFFMSSPEEALAICEAVRLQAEQVIALRRIAA